MTALGAGSVEVISCGIHTDAREIVDYTAVLGPDRFRVELGEDGSDHGCHHPLRRSWDLGQQVTQITGVAPPPRHRGEGGCSGVHSYGVRG